ncbi:MAG: YfiR family protein [Cytophagales bacterium]
MRFFKNIVILFGLNFVFAEGSYAQIPDANAANSKIKAIFLYNFTKYIEWPPHYKKGDFVIGVLGNSPIVPELEKMAERTKLGTQTFSIKRYNNINEISDCHILYVANSNNELIELAAQKLHKKSPLIISECGGCTKKGSAINFVSVDNKQRFELNKGNAGKNGLLVSSNLATLAILVD